MARTCTHLDTISGAPPSGQGCVECLQSGDSWLHLRMCQSCGHVGCCDSSKNKHATKHFRADAHPLVRSYEPGEDWFFCFPDRLIFELAGAPPAPHHA